MFKPAALLLALAAGAALAAPAEFKGVPFGASVAEFSAAHPAFTCARDPRTPGATMCSAGMEVCKRQRYGCAPRDFDASKYADEPVDLIIALFPDGRFERLEIYFPPSSYNAISTALRGRLGAPTSTAAPTVRSVAGGVARNDTALWESADATTSLSRYGDSLTQGDLFIVSAKWLATADQRDASRAARRSAGM